jgi:hypothetical protein
MKIKFRGCKYLIFDENIIDNRIKLKRIGTSIVYWHRPKELLPDSNCAADVQFCELRGRLNFKVACLDAAVAECEKYSEIIHEVEVQDDK